MRYACWLACSSRLPGFVLLVLLTVTLKAQLSQDAPQAFVDVTVVPMDWPGVLKHQTVLVKNGRILDVGGADLLQVPANTRRIEGRNLFLIPGLADMHVHLMEPERYFQLFLAYGVTTVRNMAGSPEIVRVRDRVGAGAMLGPTVYTAGPLLDGSPPIWKGSDVVTTPQQASEAVIRQKPSRYDFLKVYDNLTPAAYQAIIASAADMKMPVAGHVPPHVGLKLALEAHQWSIEHLTGYFEWLQNDSSPFKHEAGDSTYPHPAHLLAKRQALVDWADDSRIPMVATLTAKAGSWNVPTLVAWLNMASPGDLDAAWKRPGMQYETSMLRDWWNSDAGYSAEDWAAKGRGDVLRSKIVKALADAGARLVIGTDTPHPLVLPGLSVHDELTNFARLGMSLYEALKAATSGAAEFMGKSGEFGVIRSGARADLVLLAASPLEDIKNTSRIAGVSMAAGSHVRPWTAS